MESILSLLLQARGVLAPTIPQSAKEDILLTLLFWKLLSDNWRLTQRGQEAGANLRASERQAAALPVIMDLSRTYESCQWDHANNAGLALRSSLIHLAEAQPRGILNGMLRPDRFGALSPWHAAFRHSDSLARVINIIGSISLSMVSKDIGIGTIFSNVKAMFSAGANAVPAHIASLMAHLVNPQPTDEICDLQCGDGQLLQACIAKVAGDVPPHQLMVYGQEANDNAWALACMQMLLQGVQYRLERGDALERPALFTSRLNLVMADVAVLQLPEKPVVWDHASAEHENYKRFPVAPPSDGRLAMLWYALSSMKSDTGRLCCLLPLSAWSGRDGLALRRHLVQMNLLDAVIQLPTVMRESCITPQALLLVSQKRLHDTVAFISGQFGHREDGELATEYGVNEIKAAYGAYRQRQLSPWLRMANGAQIAKGRFVLDPLFFNEARKAAASA